LNKLQGPMRFKIGITCVYNGYMFYTHVITDSPISQSV